MFPLDTSRGASLSVKSMTLRGMTKWSSLSLHGWCFSLQLASQILARSMFAGDVVVLSGCSDKAELIGSGVSLCLVLFSLIVMLVLAFALSRLASTLVFTLFDEANQTSSIAVTASDMNYCWCFIPICNVKVDPASQKLFTPPGCFQTHWFI